MSQQIDLSEYNGGPMVGATAALLALSWTTIGLRTYTRAVIMRSFMADDWLMMIAQLSFTAMCACIFEGVRRGLGRHNAAAKTDDDRVAALMWQAIATVLYILSMMFVKLSIGIFLLRLSAKKVYIVIIRASLVIVALYTSGIFFWNIFQCNPVAKQWDYRITEGTCASGQDIANAAYAISALTVVSDWFYALLPIPMLWNVKMTKQAKMTVVFILGLGIFASIATLIRVKFLAALVDTSDILYTATDALLWSMVEPGVAIIASSLATIRPLLRALKIRGFETTNRWPSSGFSSRKNAAVGSSFAGRNDVSLHRVTAVSSEARAPVRASYDDYHLHAAAASGLPPPVIYADDDLGNKVSISAGEDARRLGRQLSDDSKSEIIMIEGNVGETTPPPLAGTSHGYSTSDRSTDEIDLEEQSQDVGDGLSRGRGRRF